MPTPGLALLPSTSSCPRRSFLTGAILAAASFFGPLSIGLASEPCTVCTSCAPRPIDQIWLISTRCAPCPYMLGNDAPQLQVWRYEQGQWLASDLSAFFAGDSVVPTCFWIHGNRTDAGLAQDVGLTVYRRLVSGQPDNRPVRMVIWSWPSDQEGGPLNDIRVKAPRADTTGYYLAWVLDHMSPQTPVTVIGYSYGARAATAALQWTAGGQLNGYTLANRAHPQRPPVHVALLAAAEDSDWLFPGHRHGLALSQMDQLLLLYNSCDRALERYHWLYGRRCCNEALGYVGLYTGWLPAEDQKKVTQIDVCCLVGPEHEWSNYFNAPSLLARMASLVFGAP